MIKTLLKTIHWILFILILITLSVALPLTVAYQLITRDITSQFIILAAAPITFLTIFLLYYLLIRKKAGTARRRISIILFAIFFTLSTALNTLGSFMLEEMRSDDYELFSDSYLKLDGLKSSGSNYYLTKRVSGWAEKVVFIELYKSDREITLEKHDSQSYYRSEEMKSTQLILSEYVTLDESVTKGRIDLDNRRVIVNYKNGEKKIFKF